MSKIVHASQPVSYALPSWQSVQGTQKQCPDPPVCPQAHSSLDHAQIPAHEINNQQRMQQTRCNRQQSTGISRGKQRDAATRCSTTHFLFNSQRDPSFTMRSPSRARAKPLWICWGQSSLARAASSIFSLFVNACQHISAQAQWAGRAGLQSLRQQSLGVSAVACTSPESPAQQMTN